MKTKYYMSAVAALLIMGTSTFAAEKVEKAEEVETAKLSGDSLSVNIDVHEDAPVEINTVADAFKNGKVKGLTALWCTAQRQ